MPLRALPGWTNRQSLQLALTALGCGLVVALLLLIPQIRLQQTLGAAWNGHYAATDIDEVVYAAYLETRIQGWPRLSDPYLGLRSDASNELSESFVSIQWAAPTMVAAIARIFGWDAPTAMIWLAPAAGFATAVLLVLLVGRLIGSTIFAASTSLLVIVAGAAIAGEGAAPVLLGLADEAAAYPFYPGFRRYIPAGPWPILVATIGATVGFWLSRRRATQLACGAAVGLGFAFLVFSYFYLWSTALAWIACWALTHLVVRPDQRRSALKLSVVTGLLAGTALLPYGWLLQRQSSDADELLLLELTRQPELLRGPVLVGLLAISIIALGVRRTVISAPAPAAMLAASLALVPLVTLNQQVVTGRSLQPIHFEVFTGNYLALLALMLAVGEWLRRSGALNRQGAQVACAALCLAATLWGVCEAVVTSRPLDRYNIRRDQHKGIGDLLARWAENDPDARKRHVFVVDSSIGDDLPTLTPTPPLWARHQHVFSSMPWSAYKQRYFQYLYYLGAEPEHLRAALALGDPVSTVALFGWGRTSQRLGGGQDPLSEREIDSEVSAFAAFGRALEASGRPDPVLAYAVLPATAPSPFGNLDRWYERGTPLRVGDQVLIPLQLRDRPVLAP